MTSAERTPNDRPGPEDLVSGLLRPEAYSHTPAAVELKETHISWVFLAGELVYKVKKAVVLPFLDYGTLERRRWLCHEEVRLNLRLAPHVYLGVVAIIQSDGCLSVVDETDPKAIEYAVAMHRIDEAQSMAALATRSELRTNQVERVGNRLARFHAGAAVVRGDSASCVAQMRPIEANLNTLRKVAGDAIGADALGAAHMFTSAFATANRAVIDERVRFGCVREGHGDLRAEHVIVPPSGEVLAFDCIEFDPALREIDVAADLAFLVMDLTRIGHGDLVPALVGSYRAAGGIPGDDSLLCFFAAYRAWVRAVVTWVREGELDPADPERSGLRANAEDLFILGRRFAWQARRPAVVVICGVAVSGKSTLARSLSELSGWRHLSSDKTRKRLAGIAPTERGPQSIYSQQFTDKTYRELGHLAGQEIGADRGVIVDATFHRRAARDAFRIGLGESTEVVFAECRPPDDELLRRVAKRNAEGDSVSDADASVVMRQLCELEPLLEVPEELRETLTDALTRDQLVDRVELLITAVQARQQRSAG